MTMDDVRLRLVMIVVHVTALVGGLLGGWAFFEWASG